MNLHKVLISLVLLAFVVCCTGSCKISLSHNTEFVPDIYDAENVIFTRYNSSIRLFVTGGDNIFELTRDIPSNSWKKNSLYHEKAYFLGVVQYNQWLCTVDKQGYFYAADLSVSPLVLNRIYHMEDMSLPNGMAADVESGVIYVADTAFLKSSGKIVKLRMKEAPNSNNQMNPSSMLTVTQQSDWITSPHVKHPNGLKLFNHTVMISDTNKVVAIPINRATGGPDIANMKVLFSKGLTILDDINFFTPSESDQPLLVVANYLQSSLIFLRLPTGEKLYETSKLAFAGPSALAQGVSPLFSKDQIIVTNKGLVDTHTPWGNYVSYVNATITGCY